MWTGAMRKNAAGGRAGYGKWRFKLPCCASSTMTSRACEAYLAIAGVTRLHLLMTALWFVFVGQWQKLFLSRNCSRHEELSCGYQHMSRNWVGDSWKFVPSHKLLWNWIPVWEFRFEFYCQSIIKCYFLLIIGPINTVELGFHFILF